MDEDQEKKEEKPNFLIIFFYAIIASILGGILGYIIKNSFSYFILGFFIGLIFGIILYGISLLPKEQRNIAYLILFLIFIVLVFLFFSKFNILSFPSFSLNFGNLLSWFYCLSGSEKCPAFAGFEEKNITSPDFSLSISYENDYIKDDIIDLLVIIELINKKIDNLIFYPYCDIEDTKQRISLKVYDLQQYAKEDYFIFPKSKDKLSTSFRCNGKARYQKEDLIIGFNIPYTSDLTWIIYTSSSFQQIEEKKGKIITSEMPFEIIIDFYSDMPLQNKKYDFFIKLRQNPNYNFYLKRINFFEISSTPDTQISCENFGNRFENYDEEKLKEYYNKNKKEYVFNCELFISNAPKDVVEQRIINIKANYIIYKELKKTLRKI
ncbi:MAG: hypothetical protein QXO12_00845 [Candidatus Pacearchaeota archaeon]